jgi:hypothetical protein
MKHPRVLPPRCRARVRVRVSPAYIGRRVATPGSTLRRSKQRKMKLSLSCDAGSFTRGQLLAVEKIKRAATDTVREAAQLAKEAGRRSMAAGGFSSRFQNALRVKLYPEQGTSVHPAAVIYDKIDWAGVFEVGATISAGGDKLLWVALDSAPVGAGGHHLSPKEYIAAGGKLISVNVPGKPPMLGTMVNDRAAGPWGRKRFTKRQLLRGGYKQGSAGTAMRFQPLYIGKPQVTDPKKFDVQATIAEVADFIPELFAAHFAKD